MATQNLLSMSREKIPTRKPAEQMLEIFPRSVVPSSYSTPGTHNGVSLRRQAKTLPRFGKFVHRFPSNYHLYFVEMIEG